MAISAWTTAGGARMGVPPSSTGGAPVVPTTGQIWPR